MSHINQNMVTKIQPVEAKWKGLCNAGGMAALTMLVLMVIQIIIYTIWPPPSTAEGFFSLFNKSWLLGLLSLDLLYIVDSILLILIYLALYVALKQYGESSMLIALVFGIVGVAAYFASNTAFEMLSLSSQYSAAATETQRMMLLTEGQVMLETYKGTAFDVYYVLNTINLFIFSLVMLRSNVFSKMTAYFGILAALLMIIPSTAGVLGLYFSLASLIPWAIWLVLVAKRFFKLAAN